MKLKNPAYKTVTQEMIVISVFGKCQQILVHGKAKNIWKKDKIFKSGQKNPEHIIWKREIMPECVLASAQLVSEPTRIPLHGP